MTVLNIKIALALVWVLSAITVLMGSAHLTSTTNRVALAMFGILPPLAMWFWWNDPTQSLSESIHQVRDERIAPRPNRLAD
jgi:HAMP domain-containing protein